MPQTAWPPHRAPARNLGAVAEPATSRPESGQSGSGQSGSGPPDTPYQSLYRRFRPQRFAEVRGQDHITRALRNSVRNATVSHAYLFSGPRGTGKTSTARILAKALNCASPEDGEPCCRCDSCLAVAAGSSMDVHELDAASNNGVDAMRDLVARAALGTPGRWKVYIVDEVHMLSAAASNALLKTLEEPPGHVIFVLATTDPQKVLDTIKSRTQHFEFRLLAGPVLASLLKDVSVDASLGLPPEAIDMAVRRGRGSARDALSFLDQVAAAGEVEDEAETLDRIIEAMAEGDAAGVLTAVAEAQSGGQDPQRLGAELLAQLRFAFLATMAPDLVPLPDEARLRAAEQAARLGTPGVVRAMEAIGRALADMREALDPRVFLEVALIGVAHGDRAAASAAAPSAVGSSPTASAAAHPGAQPELLARLEQLEKRVAELEASPSPTRQAPDAGRGGRQALGAVRASSVGPGSAGTASPPSTAPPKTKPAAATKDESAGGASASEAASGPFPSRDDVVKAWGDGLLQSLKGRARALYRTGRFAEVENGQITFAVPNEPHRNYSEECKREVEDALQAHFGVRMAIRLVVEPDPLAPGGSSPASGGAVGASDLSDPGDHIDLADTSAAPPSRPEDRLLQAFPGAEEIDG